MKDKYDGATEVRVNKRGRLQVKNAQYNLPTANDLVYLDESPDYCLRNKTIGSFGKLNFKNLNLNLIILNFFFKWKKNRYLRQAVQPDVCRDGRLQSHVLRTRLQHAQDDGQRALQVQIPLVLSRRVQDLHQNGRHSHLQVIENDSWRGATDKWMTTTNTTTSYKNPSQFSKITLKRKKEKLKHKTNTILLYQLFLEFFSLTR